MSQRLLPIEPVSHLRHPMHADERIWSETNCYVDLWVELLHALGHDPVPAAAAALSADFDGRQWRFLKFEAADLRLLYGIDVLEMNVWRTVLEHVEEELSGGRLLTLEVDAYWLPDTAGTSYHQEHIKTTVVINGLDTERETAEYFHNSGYYRLDVADFRGVFRLDGAPEGVLPPYVEMLRLDSMHPIRPDDAIELVRAHLARRPAVNPVKLLADRVRSDLSWLAGSGLDTFHRWSFGVLRQCGATAELAADLSNYLAEAGIADADLAAERFREVALGAKSVQFRLARAAARGREVFVDEELATMAECWDLALGMLAARL